jgi:two-component system response regulator VicR
MTVSVFGNEPDGPDALRIAALLRSEGFIVMTESEFIGSSTLQRIVARCQSSIVVIVSPYDQRTARFFNVGSLVLDRKLDVTHYSGRSTMLTSLEANVLEELMIARGSVCAASDLVRRFWEGRPKGKNSLSVLIHSLRYKLEANPKMPKLLMTKRGQGFYLQLD